MPTIWLCGGFGWLAGPGMALATPRRRPARVMKAPPGSQPAAIMPRKQGNASKLAQMARQILWYDRTVVSLEHICLDANWGGSKLLPFLRFGRRTVFFSG